MMGTSYGVNPTAQQARDIAVLKAYNDQLVAKGCATFDLDNELMPKPVTETPRPVRKDAPAAKPKA
jgi:hypothetical protein